ARGPRVRSRRRRPRGCVVAAAPRGCVVAAAPRGCVVAAAPRGCVVATAPRVARLSREQGGRAQMGRGPRFPSLLPDDLDAVVLREGGLVRACGDGLFAPVPLRFEEIAVDA